MKRALASLGSTLLLVLLGITGITLLFGAVASHSIQNAHSHP